ncbi:hypothetical protein AGRA3207_004523 [Actinomadura graeca]|uniref:Uncharacterized protein n=1 Tax=Actinomadura graeca TaxID=2750812 RepID=A0ABX8QZE8_9ACTN|nr:hypothetical protein [Actinomadura graeca]QXJ23379.1 hypothetical protein AGRA3207_004523 [Actinomadura graeca]
MRAESMAKLPIRRTPAYVAFIDHLRRFYAYCGDPQQKHIIEVVSKTHEMYLLKDGGRARKVEITAPWLSQLLNGKLEALPSADKLAALVLALQHWAVAIGLEPEDPGRAALPEWQELLRQAKGNAKQEACDGVLVTDGLAEEIIRGPVRRPVREPVREYARRAAGASKPPDTAMSRREDGQEHHVERAARVHLTPGELNYLLRHGSYASTIAPLIGDGHALYDFQGAVIFACSAEHLDTAFVLLKSAAAAGDRRALDLFALCQEGLTVQMGVEHARLLAEEYRLSGKRREYHTFRSCATNASVHDGKKYWRPLS